MLFETPRVLFEKNKTLVERRLLDELFLERKILLLGAMHSERSFSLILQLKHLEEQAPGEEIEVFISSPGGDIAAGLSVIDVMQEISSPVKTVCFDAAYGIAAVIFAAGSKRELHRNSKLSFLESYAATEGTARTMSNAADELTASNEAIIDVLVDVAGLTDELAREIILREPLLSAEEAVNLGLADLIIPSFSKDYKSTANNNPLN